jgi:hypothetical protein
MTVPPLPALPTLRVRLDYTQADTFRAGSRFFLTYANAAPTPGNCATIASDISAAWGTHIAPNVDAQFALSEVDVLDLASYSGSSGQWTGSIAGSAGGTSLPSQTAVNVEFGVARRYRGGKPRIFFPPPTTSEQLDAGHWTVAFVDGMTGAVSDFFTEIEALSVGAVGALTHVNLSYYAGFTNVTNSSGRTRAAPKYRATALVDTVESYAVKSVLGSQRRRRTATTY